MSMNAEGGLWAGQEIKHGGKTQHANLESKMLNACSDDEEYDEYDEYVDVPVSGRRELCIAETREGRRYTDVCVDGRQDLPAGANAGTSTAREWVDSPQKARLYGDRPPLIAAAGAASMHLPWRGQFHCTRCPPRSHAMHVGAGWCSNTHGAPGTPFSAVRAS